MNLVSPLSWAEVGIGWGQPGQSSDGSWLSFVTAVGEINVIILLSPPKDCSDNQVTQNASFITQLVYSV